MNINEVSFTTKIEYLQWRAEWRAAYRELSEKIRAAKWIRTVRAQALSKAMPELREKRPFPGYYQALNELQKKYLEPTAARTQILMAKHFPNPVKCWYPAYALKTMRPAATAMLEVRKASKMEAQRQFLANQQKLEHI
jgi:hypothetical protein